MLNKYKKTPIRQLEPTVITEGNNCNPEITFVLLVIQSFLYVQLPMYVPCFFNSNSNSLSILKAESVKLASNVRTIYLTL